MGKIVIIRDWGMKHWSRLALVTLCAVLVGAAMSGSAFALNTIMHNSSTVGNKYGSWGLDKDCSWCHSAGSTSNIKKVRETISTPGGDRSVIFYRMTSVFNNATGVMGNELRTYGRPQSTNVCEVCHSRTAFHRYSAVSATRHQDNKMCTTCHEHGTGFVAKGHEVPFYAGSNHAGHIGCASSSTGCHANVNPAATYPATGGSEPDCRACHKLGDPLSAAPVYGCGSCHGDVGGTGEPTGTVYPNVAGSHAIHTAIGGVTCVRCHSNGGTGSTVNHGSSNRGTVVGFVNVTSASEPVGWRSSNSTCANASCHVNVYGTGFISTPAWGTPSGCAACHTAPIGATGPATGSHNASGHAVECEYCHAAGTTSTTSPASGHINTKIDVAGTGINIPVVGYPANVNKHASGSGYSSCSTAQCHSNVYGPGYITTPVWGDSSAGCAACHTTPYPFQAYGAPATGSHDKHMTTIVGIGCGNCHTAAVQGVSGGPVDIHGNGFVNVKDALQYVYSSVYDSANPRPKHAPGTPGSSSSYGTCSASCHASPYNALNIESPVWGAAAGCASCHMADGAFLPALGGAPNTGSHDKHMGQGATCGNCHTGAISGVTGGNSHPNTVVNVSSGYTASPVTKHDPGTYTGYCNNASCHSNGRGVQIDSPVWGMDNNDCTVCHGGNSASVTPIATQKHRSHMNNYSTLGRNNNLKCAACHALTVAATSDRFVTTPANHFNGVYNYSGAMAGRSANYNLTTKACNNGYCHSSGQAVPVYRNMTGGLAWNGAVKLDCSGCHGSSAGAVWSTTLGAPNYHNNSTTTRNSHQRHVSAMITDTTGCSRCHNGTVSSTVADRLKDDNQAHINKVRDVNFSVFGVYSSRTMSCTAYCHSNVQAPQGNGPATIYAKPSWGVNGSLTCSSCHADMANLAETTETLKLGSHRRHATFDNTTSGTSGAGYSCELCHGTGYSPTTTNDSIHANQKINVKFTGKAAGSVYTQYSSGAGNGYGTCSSNRCHGRAVRSWGINTTNPTCEKCHGSARTAQQENKFYDTTISSQQYAGAHVRHLNPQTTVPISCNSCHTVPSSIFSFGHMSSMNGVVSAKVRFTGLALHTSLQTNVGMTPVYTATGDLATSTCNTTYCHAGFKTTAMGTGTEPAWGDSSYFGCGKCHGDPPGGAHPVVPSNQCNACHDHVDGTGTGFLDKSKHVNGFVETTADDCLVCHAPESSNLCVDNGSGGHWFAYDHSQACFPMALKGGHATHTDVEYFLQGKKLSTGDYIDPNWIYSIKYKKGFPQFACGFCHPMDVAAHKAGIVSVELDPDTAQLGTVKAKNRKKMTTPPAGYYNTWMKTYIPYTKQGGTFTPGTVVCNNVYCHSNGYVSPETNAYIFTETPDWYYADKNGGTSFWAGKDNCAQCHGNSPNTDPNDGQGLKIGSPAHGRHVVGNHYKDIFNGYSGKLTVAAASGARAHGNPDNSTTFNCNICHYDTVRVSSNDKGSVCKDCHNGTTASLRGTMQLYTTNASSHVNGRVDVVFMDPFNVKSKAQVRNPLSAVQGLYTSWTRVNGYKSYSSSHDHARQKPAYVGGTCSTVTCHNGTPMEWRSKGPLACAACHTSLTN